MHFNLCSGYTPAENRAYLYYDFQKIKGTFPITGDRVTLNIPITNTGKTPAHKVLFYPAFHYGYGMTQVLFDTLTNTKSVGTEIVINPNQVDTIYVAAPLAFDQADTTKFVKGKHHYFVGSIQI